MPLHFSPDVMLVLMQYLEFEDAVWLATAGASTQRSAEAASSFLSSISFKGMELFRRPQCKGALFHQLRESLDPKLLLTLHRCPLACRACSLTLPMPIAFDTSGRFFVLFRVYHDNPGYAPHGPALGVVDLVGARTRPIKLAHDDWSRPHRQSDFFGISCNPFTGRIHASHTSAVPLKGFEDIPENGLCPPRSWSADVLGWEPVCSEIGAAVDVGMLISDGTLEFVRTGPYGYECSGVVWDRLPEKIVCCAFLSGFVGAASVLVQKVCTKHLDGYNLPQDCDLCGELSPWAPWPAVS